MSAGESESLACLNAVQGLEAEHRASGAPGISNRSARTKNSTCVAATDEAQRLFAFFRCSRSFSFSQNISKMSWSAQQSCGTLTVKGACNLRIVERHLDVQVSEVAATEALCHAQWPRCADAPSHRAVSCR